MALPTYEQALATASTEPAFSNGTEFEAWQGTHCERCLNDLPYRQGNPGDGCVLLLVALDGRTPAEWAEDKPGYLGQQYRCTYFRSEDNGPDPEPQPFPDPPGQLTLAPRAPFERPARMLAPTRTDAEVAR
jgi:hypothetical protein